MTILPARFNIKNGAIYEEGLLTQNINTYDQINYNGEFNL